MDILKNYNKILANINDISKNTIVIVVSKTFSIIHFKPIIDVGHIHFGENRVQECIDKWMHFLNNEAIQRIYEYANEEGKTREWTR